MAIYIYRTKKKTKVWKPFGTATHQTRNEISGVIGNSLGTGCLMIRNQNCLKKKKKTIVSGEDEEEEFGVLEQGEFFGEVALMKKEKRTANVVAMHPGAECLTLDRE